MKRPWSLMEAAGFEKAAHAAGRHVPARVGLGAVGLWFLLASAPAWGQPPRPFVPETSRAKRAADAVSRERRNFFRPTRIATSSTTRATPTAGWSRTRTGSRPRDSTGWG